MYFVFKEQHCDGQASAGGAFDAVFSCGTLAAAKSEVEGRIDAAKNSLYPAGFHVLDGVSGIVWTREGEGVWVSEHVEGFF